MTGFHPGERKICRARRNCRVVCNILAEAAFIRRSRPIEYACRFLGKYSSFGEVSSFKNRSDARRGILLNAEESCFLFRPTGTSTGGKMPIKICQSEINWGKFFTPVICLTQHEIWGTLCLFVGNACREGPIP